MGSSILGDGRPAFILDLIELFSGTMKKKNTNFNQVLAA
jgi:two-component system chemotaxis sensor kinase CheA